MHESSQSSFLGQDAFLHLEASMGVCFSLGFSLGLASVIFGASYILAVSDSDTEKLSSYECGFDPYEDARNAFDVRFYLVAILFLLFDIETIFLFPWRTKLIICIVSIKKRT